MTTIWKFAVKLNINQPACHLLCIYVKKFINQTTMIKYSGLEKERASTYDTRIYYMIKEHRKA